MSEWRLVRLNFGQNPVHFGETGIGLEKTLERVRSDTLFSAWISAYARVFGKTQVEALLQQFIANPEKPPFRVSSTFVYRRNEDTDQLIDYLPKPVERPDGYPSEDLSFAKAYKKLHYLPLAVWQRWYQGSGFSEQDRLELEAYGKRREHPSTALANAGCFAYGEAFQSYELPKVAIDRTTRATNFYHTGLIQFAWKPDPTVSVDVWSQNGVQNLAGLYFLLEFPEANPNLEADLQQALTLLGEEGIGGERSSGAGRFSVLTWGNLSPEWQNLVNFDQGNRYGLISLLWDQNMTIEAGDRYMIQERGGWIASPFSGRQLRRQMVRMLAEGSVFRKQPVGQLANVTPPGFTQHPIYRSGLAVSLPIKLA